MKKRTINLTVEERDMLMESLDVKQTRQTITQLTEGSSYHIMSPTGKLVVIKIVKEK